MGLLPDRRRRWARPALAGLVAVLLVWSVPAGIGASADSAGTARPSDRPVLVSVVGPGTAVPLHEQRASTPQQQGQASGLAGDAAHARAGHLLAGGAAAVTDAATPLSGLPDAVSARAPPVERATV